MPVPQGRFGYFSINSTLYPVYAWRPTSPRNLVSGEPVGNSWGTNLAEGVKTSRIVAQFMVRNTAAEILSTSFWDYFLTRSFSGGFDDTPALSIVGSTGKKTRTYSNCKAESLTLTWAFGAVVGLTAVFLCPGMPAKANVTPTDYSTNVNNSPLLMFDQVTIGGVTGSTYGGEIVLANNHKPNGTQNGSKNLTSWDAGNITASLSLTVAEHSTTGEPVADGGTVTVALAGASTRTLSLTGCTVNNPDDVDANPGQIFQNKQYIVQGSTSVQPVTYT